MSELVRVVQLVAIHQSVDGFKYWDKAGDGVHIRSEVFESEVPVDFHVRKTQGKVEYRRTTPNLRASEYGLLGIADVDKDQVDPKLGIVVADKTTIKEIVVFCNQMIPGHGIHPKDDYALGMRKKEWEEELQRRDMHDVPITSGLLTVNKDGLIQPLCDSPYQVPADGKIMVVGSFRKEGSKLIFKKPSTDIEESIIRLRQKEQQRINEFHQRTSDQEVPAQTNRKRNRKGRK